MAIYKRPGSKYYWFKFYFGGELVQRSSKCTNKTDARTVESAFRTQLALGKIGIEPKKEIPTFEQAADDFLKFSKVEHANQPGTYRRYDFACQTLKSFFGKIKAGNIESKDIEKFIVWRSSQTSRKTGKPIKRKTVNFELLILKTIFKRLVNDKILRESPARAVKQLTEEINDFHVLTDEEEKRYLLAAPQPLKDVAALMLETGLRCAEVYQLKRGDVYLEKNFLQVTKGKTKASVRRVHLSDRAREILRYRLKRFDRQYLFPQNDIDGEPATKSLNKMHLTTIRRLGFSFRLYDCRHTFATRALESGVDLLTLAAILGHANLKMVSRYAHPSEDHKADAIRRMQQARIPRKAKAV